MLGNQWDLNFQDILVKMTVSELFDRILRKNYNVKPIECTSLPNRMQNRNVRFLFDIKLISYEVYREWTTTFYKMRQ